MESTPRSLTDTTTAGEGLIATKMTSNETEVALTHCVKTSTTFASRLVQLAAKLGLQTQYSSESNIELNDRLCIERRIG